MADLTGLLKKVNARKRESSARLVGEEAARAREQLAEADFARQLAEEAAKNAEPEPPSDLRRSTMSAAAKSAYIQARGLDKYNKLPFK